MIDFTSTLDNYTGDLMELIRAFHLRTDKDFSLHLDYSVEGDRMSVSLKLSGEIEREYTYNYTIVFSDEMERKRLEKRHLKEAIYNTIVDYTGVELPYGCLTGIRPTKLFRELGERARDMF